MVEEKVIKSRDETESIREVAEMKKEGHCREGHESMDKEDKWATDRAKWKGHCEIGYTQHHNEFITLYALIW